MIARLCVPLLLCGIPSIAGAVVIDRFASPDQRVDHPVNQSTRTTSTVDYSGGVFDSRYLQLSFGSGQRLVVAGNALEYELPEPGENRGYFEVRWGSALLVNLLASGAHSFRLIFESVSLSGTFPAKLEFVGLSGTGEIDVGGQLAAHVASFGNNAPLVLDLPFDEFRRNRDFSSVTTVTLSGYRIHRGAGFTLVSITAIPEPSVAALMAISLVFCMRRRR